MNIYLFQQSQKQWDKLNQSLCNSLDIDYIPSLVQPLDHIPRRAQPLDLETFTERHRKRNIESIIKLKLVQAKSMIVEHLKNKLSESKRKHNQYQKNA